MKPTNYKISLTADDGKLFCHVKLEGLKCPSRRQGFFLRLLIYRNFTAVSTVKFLDLRLTVDQRMFLKRLQVALLDNLPHS